MDTLERAEFEALFKAHSVRLGRFLAQVAPSRWQADDLMQDTFLAAWKDREQLAAVANPEAWLFAIARHRALNAMRQSRRGWNALRRLASEREASTGDPAEIAAVRDVLAKHLSPEDRILLILRYVHGFDSNELSKMTDRTPEAVRQQLSRARRRLVNSLNTEPTPPVLGEQKGGNHDGV